MAYPQGGRCARTQGSESFRIIHATGGISPFAARRLRRLARAAAENDNDTTDYTLSSTARAFVPYYSQRICAAIRMHGAQGILQRISRARRDRLRVPQARA